MRTPRAPGLRPTALASIPLAPPQPRPHAPRRPASALLGLCTALCAIDAIALAQPPEPDIIESAPQTQPDEPAAEPLSTDALAQLAAIRDYTLDFDQPGFYAVVEHVRRHGVPPAPDAQPLSDWRELAERPRDFRGRPVTITARVGHNRAWSLASRPHLGVLHQLELYDPRQPIAITAILTGAAEDIPLESEITLTGCFVMMRSYQTPSGQTRYAALLVADGPVALVRAAVPVRTPLLGRGDALTGIIAAVAGGLLIALILFRRSARTRSASRLAAALRAPEDDRWIEEADAHPTLHADAEAPPAAGALAPGAAPPDPATAAGTNPHNSKAARSGRA
ncbi:MAG: hypothetical protein IPM64_16360 [Phycisphaerales bacterium]|nr:hypothetical protein [Phycisphaerales bacterium]